MLLQNLEKTAVLNPRRKINHPDCKSSNENFAFTFRRRHPGIGTGNLVHGRRPGAEKA
jgi:hypothetical protein